VLRWCVHLSLASSVLSLAINPSHPLWPSGWVYNKLDASARFHPLASRMKPYLLFRERSITGVDIVSAIPADEQSFVGLVGEDQPLLSLFQGNLENRHVLFLAPHATPQELIQQRARYIVVGAGANTFYPELCVYLAESGNYELVVSHDYVSRLSSGPQTWMLYRAVLGTNVPDLKLH
jgi:hypothetical protein